MSRDRLPNVLLSSAGRRVALMGALKESLRSRRPNASVHAVDSGLTASARFVADHFWQVPRCTAANFGTALLDICRRESAGLVIPTIDTELPVLARLRDEFTGHGVTLSVSGQETVEICGDKKRTHDWLVASGLPTVKQAPIREAISESRSWRWPLIIKPHDGSASLGVQRVESESQLNRLVEEHPGYIAQEMARGKEFTINLYVNRAGKCVCAVPHWRIEVRAGEVSKGLTVKNEKLMDLGRKATELLPDARGPLNMQCFLDDDGLIAIIELNARFGGGYPLAHRAGARFTDWLLDEQEGHEVAWFDGWQDDLAMLRYDDAVFVSGDRLRTA